MNHEKFNDAMCRLRQAEEMLNMALRDIYIAISESEKQPMYGEMIEDKDIYDAVSDTYFKHSVFLQEERNPDSGL